MVTRPRICFHCSIFGHSKKRCIRKDKDLCQRCFHDHKIGVSCIISCKNCTGPHLSSHSVCEVLHEEVKILKLRDSLGMSYPEAKAVHMNLSSSQSSADPLDITRLKLQEMVNRCSNLVLAGRKQTDNNNLLIEAGNRKSVKITELKKALDDQKVVHKMEVDELSEKNRQSFNSTWS